MRRKKNGNIDFWWFVARRQKKAGSYRDWYGFTLFDSLKTTVDEWQKRVICNGISLPIVVLFNQSWYGGVAKREKPVH